MGTGQSKLLPTVASSGGFSALQKHEVIKLVWSERGEGKRGDYTGLRDELLHSIRRESRRLWGFDSSATASRLRCL